MPNLRWAENGKRADDAAKESVWGGKADALGDAQPCRLNPEMLGSGGGVRWRMDRCAPYELSRARAAPGLPLRAV